VKSFNFIKPKELFGKKIFLDADAPPDGDGASRNIPAEKLLMRDFKQLIANKSVDRSPNYVVQVSDISIGNENKN
jgi:hypothetical protein